jgi:hypothetical protein
MQNKKREGAFNPCHLLTARNNGFSRAALQSFTREGFKNKKNFNVDFTAIVYHFSDPIKKEIIFTITKYSEKLISLLKIKTKKKFRKLTHFFNKKKKNY